MERIEIRGEVLESIWRTYQGQKPPHAVLQSHLMQFGLADAASLILGIWPIMFPRDGRPKCPFKGPMTGPCRSRIIANSYDRLNKEVVLMCEEGHETVQRKGRISRDA